MRFQKLTLSRPLLLPQDRKVVGESAATTNRGDPPSPAWAG
jgi:hypothetical protein